MPDNYLNTVESEQRDSKDGRNGINQQLDDWLPITQSRNGNSWTSTFHLLCSGIGTQTLSLPLAFVYLGWFWGILCLLVAFVWQLYTIGLLVNLHESVPNTRYNRYLQLSMAAFGDKLGKMLAIFPVLYLAGGTCVMFIITGGGTLKLFYQLLCEDCSSKHPLTTTEWFLVFICLAILVSLFCPNLHSVALISFLGSIMAVGYCTMLWVFLVAKGYNSINLKSPVIKIHVEMSGCFVCYYRVVFLSGSSGWILDVWKQVSGQRRNVNCTLSLPSPPHLKTSSWCHIHANCLKLYDCFSNLQHGYL